MNSRLLTHLATVGLVGALILAAVVASPGMDILALIGLGICASATVRLTISATVARISEREKVGR